MTLNGSAGLAIKVWKSNCLTCNTKGLKQGRLPICSKANKMGFPYKPNVFSHVQYTQTDTNHQNTLTNRTIGKWSLFVKVALSIGAIGTIGTNRFQRKSS